MTAAAALDKISSWWVRHAEETQLVSVEIHDNISELSGALPESDCLAYARITMHVFGAHLGSFSEARALMQKLMQHNAEIKSLEFLNLQLAILDLAETHCYKTDNFSFSDQIKIQAGAVQIHVGLDQTELAQEKYQKALNLMQSFDESENNSYDLLIAYKAMAISSNNLACQYEEEVNLTAAESALMLQAAHRAREFWEKAGSWLEIERAEYRLSQSYLKTGNLKTSERHARLCLEICNANRAPALEFFFAYQAMAMAKPDSVSDRTQATEYFNKLDEADKSWCEAELNKLKLPKL